ncbi:amino acid ABC transporter membrane protein 2, PAAT family [Streptomyces sp. DvalAA-14]|uniref:amino acid ABC transporter permease n=1 Tax=unclassified Streptomyces TaxID=2593676 RepID=UPI00081B5A9F|nr:MULTISPECIES: amino acid ABC transporter permease [unclassified Streptomyces]MYS20255.1 ABC transporter permease subunit [Streptomyces sp. SID4948]SCD64685.1 amino acid ABC transporter membrane protein 2, PAAT family [Streptomyces sp. DvalAA-14]
MPPWAGPVADYLATGLRETALLALAAIAASLLAGILVGAVLTQPSRPVRAVARAYVEIWRGLPIIIILYFIFFVLPIIGVRVDTFSAAVIGLSLWGSANMAEVVRGAVQSVPRGQAEAAAALGFSWTGRMRHVLLPQAARRALPPVIGLVVNLTQQTSLAAVIGLLDILEASQRSIERLTLSGGSSHAVPILGAVLAVFFVICLPLTMLSRWYERRLH